MRSDRTTNGLCRAKYLRAVPTQKVLCIVKPEQKSDMHQYVKRTISGEVMK
jgi:hypothetical protein